MSENLENKSITVDNTETEQDKNMSDETTNSKQIDEIVNSDEQLKQVKEEGNIDGFAEFLQDLFSRKSEIDKELEDKKAYLSSNLAKYDTDDYFGNDSFKELYTEAFNSLGTNLDTEKFVNLLDNYVTSRIEKHTKDLSAKKETDGLTDSFRFETGVSHKSDKKLRMQDIPVEELEKYIAKYV